MKQRSLVNIEDISSHHIMYAGNNEMFDNNDKTPNFDPFDGVLSNFEDQANCIYCIYSLNGVVGTPGGIVAFPKFA